MSTTIKIGHTSTIPPITREATGPRGPSKRAGDILTKVRSLKRPGDYAEIALPEGVDWTKFYQKINGSVKRKNAVPFPIAIRGNKAAKTVRVYRDAETPEPTPANT